MPVVKVSPKYQIVIPKEVRTAMGIKPGDKIQIIQIGDRLEFVPVRNTKEMRGYFKGLDTTVERDEDRV